MRKSDLMEKLRKEILMEGDSPLLKYSYTEGEMTTSWHRHSLVRTSDSGRPKLMTANEFMKALEKGKIEK